MFFSSVFHLFNPVAENWPIIEMCFAVSVFKGKNQNSENCISKLERSFLDGFDCTYSG